jgi:hypothetical protein
MRILDPGLCLMDAVAFDAQAMHRQPVSRRDTTAGTVDRDFVNGTALGSIVTAVAHGLSRMTVAYTRMRGFGEAVVDLRFMALETRRRMFPRLGDVRPRVAAGTRGVVTEGQDVQLVIEGVRTPVHVRVAHRARCAAVKAQVPMMATTA